MGISFGEICHGVLLLLTIYSRADWWGCFFYVETATAAASSFIRYAITKGKSLWRESSRII